jgi:hypothetical protein
LFFKPTTAVPSVPSPSWTRIAPLHMNRQFG